MLGGSDTVILMTRARKDAVAASDGKPRLDTVIRLTDDVCQACLNDEYAVLCRDLAGVLARKRPSPLIRAHVETWACAITYTLGTVNFLFDPADQP